jgi:hypothetical protein
VGKAKGKGFNTEGAEERRRKIREEKRRLPQRSRGRRENQERRRARLDETEPAATNSPATATAGARPFDPALRDLKMNRPRKAGAIHKQRPYRQRRSRAALRAAPTIGVKVLHRSDCDKAPGRRASFPAQLVSWLSLWPRLRRSRAGRCRSCGHRRWTGRDVRARG